MKPILRDEYRPWWWRIWKGVRSPDLAPLYALLAMILMYVVAILIAGAWDSGTLDPHSVDACLYSRYAFGC